MRPKSWWSVILTMGLFMALSPLSAQAGPNRSFASQPHRQAFTPSQPRNFANGLHSQPHRFQQPPGHAYGWNGQHRQWNQPNGHAYGWNHQNRQWHQPYGHAYGWNGHQRWDQHRNVYGRNGQQHQWQQRPNGGQHNNPDPAYNRAGYRGHRQSPNTSPSPSGYSHDRNTTIPAGQTGAQPRFRLPDGSENAPLPQGQSTEGVI